MQLRNKKRKENRKYNDIIKGNLGTDLRRGYYKHKWKRKWNKEMDSLKRIKNETKRLSKLYS